jgi:hypothetical protein
VVSSTSMGERHQPAARVAEQDEPQLGGGSPPPGPPQTPRQTIQSIIPCFILFLPQHLLIASSPSLVLAIVVVTRRCFLSYISYFGLY